MNLKEKLKIDNVQLTIGCAGKRIGNWANLLYGKN